MRKVIVCGRPRVHIALADMSFQTGRAFCGVGFAFDGLCTYVAMRESDRNAVEQCVHLDDRAMADLTSVLGRLSAANGSYAHCTVQVAPPSHSGFGTKTTLLLSAIVGYNHLFHIQANPGEIKRLAGRGGTSGIGINAFFEGGVIWDAGHAPVSGEKQLNLPSGSKRDFVPPLALGRWIFPEEWCLALVLPIGGTFSGQAEEEFFIAHAPCPLQDTLVALAHLYHGVVPAFALKDMPLLTRSLQALSKVGFKRDEIENQGNRVRELIIALQSRNLAAGMSSMGPLVYVIAHKKDLASIRIIETTASENGARFLGCFSGCNSGYSISDGGVV